MTECGDITIDLGYSGHVTIVIRWTDDNCLSYQEQITISAEGEKPKMMRIALKERSLFARIGQHGEEING